MRLDIIKLLFPEKAKLIEEGKCPLCEASTKGAEFRDTVSQKEFHISGMCQSCQDYFFQT
jgi:hypothetical protein